MTDKERLNRIKRLVSLRERARDQAQSALAEARRKADSDRAAVATAEPLVLLRRDPKEEAYITRRLGGPGLPQAQTKARRRRQLFLRFERYYVKIYTFEHMYSHIYVIKQILMKKSEIFFSLI